MNEKKKPISEPRKVESSPQKTLWTGNNEGNREGKFSCEFKPDTLKKLEDFEIEIELDQGKQKSHLASIKHGMLRRVRY